MSRTQMRIAAPAEAVFHVLGDGDQYADWVVGAHAIDRSDREFPAESAVLVPSVGFAGFAVRGRTQVVNADPPRLLELDARVKGIHVRIRFQLEEDDGTTVVTMEENGIGRFSRRLMSLTRPLVQARNAETLWRLREQVLNAGDVSRPAPTGARSTPPIPRWLSDSTARVFGTLAALRGDRAFHPRGVTHRGRAVLTAVGAALADRPDPEVLVRFSRGIGLSDRLPDINGLAIRIVDAAGAGRHRDLLFASVGKGALSRVLVPGVDFGRTRFSSILRFRWQGSPALLTATVRPRNLTLSELRAGPGAEVTVSAAGSDGKVTLLEVTTAEIVDGRGVGMWAPPPDDVLVPVGFLNALRAPAYAASQAASGVD